MKWICNYCQKVIEKDNFIEVLEAGVEDEEYHALRRIMEQLGVADSKIETIPLVMIRSC